MERQHDLGFPDNLCLGDRLQDLKNGDVRHVPLTCRRQASIKSNLKTGRAPILFQKHLSRPHRTHRVAARRTMTDPIYLPYRLHFYSMIIIADYIFVQI